MFKEQNFFKKKRGYSNPNKYIIKKGKFIRDFKKLYEKIDDPWNQTKNLENDEQFLFFLSGLFNYFNKRKELSILDIGAGSGILSKYLKKKLRYLGTDVHNKKYKKVIFDDVNQLNKSFINKFNVILCLKTIYYVSDNINNVINNVKKYLKKEGVLLISYNIKLNSFSNKYLTDLKLRKILMKKGLKELYTIEINRELFLKKNKEKMTFFVFQKR